MEKNEELVVLQPHHKKQLTIEEAVALDGWYETVRYITYEEYEKLKESMKCPNGK